MAKSIISEGKTSTEAIENGLKQLKVSKDKVEIKILESEEKRSFFSILAPRIVKVELTLKEEEKESNKEHKPIKEEKQTEKEKRTPLNKEEIEKIKENLEKFLNEFIANMENMQYDIKFENEYVYVTLNGKDAGKLIGYRGETLNSMQTILSAIANKQVTTKRQKALEELADKLTRTVINTGKQVTLEPMPAYERKIIHNRLQDSKRVKTYSIGEEPYRKVVITKK